MVDISHMQGNDKYLTIWTHPLSEKQSGSATDRVGFIPVNAEGTHRRYLGYYNDTQHRSRAGIYIAYFDP